jgi:Fe-S-cluster-containing hydrogenase component 2
MKEGVDVTGVPSKKELDQSSSVPSKEALEKGAVVFIECFQLIPCNPCSEACPHGAIVMEGFPCQPRLIVDECMGCGLCIPCCPGQAIFVVDKTYSETEASISFPYEFLPYPKVGEEVEAVNREGKVVTKGRVIRVLIPPKYDHTAVITITVPKKFAEEVRSISRKRGGKNK